MLVQEPLIAIIMALLKRFDAVRKRVAPMFHCQSQHVAQVFVAVIAKGRGHSGERRRRKFRILGHRAQTARRNINGVGHNKIRRLFQLGAERGVFARQLLFERQLQVLISPRNHA